jgi:ketosteroid isomerase-like protein
VSEEDVQVVAGALVGSISDEGAVDMIALASASVPPAFARAIDPAAETRFFTAGGGTLGEMTGPFTGVDGFRAGWREWTAPFDSFTAIVEEVVDGGDGRVLLLVETRARLRGGGPEVRDHTAALYTVRDGRITAIDHYLDQDDARRAAGVAGHEGSSQ